MVYCMSDAVLLTVENKIATLTLNRPEFLNAFNENMGRAWSQKTAEAVKRDDVAVIIVDAAGRSFCAGGDIRAMAEVAERAPFIEELAGVINDGIISLVRSEKPVVAAAHGTTAGGGLGILLSTDYAVVGESSKIGSLYAGVGLTPDLSVSALLSRAVGERRALQLSLQERMLTAEEALQWGLVAEVVSDDEVGLRARQIAEHWRDGATYAYGQAKRLLRSSFDRSFEEQLAEEARTISRASVTPEGDARIKAFAKRG